MTRYWRCRRVTQGVTCGTLNLAQKRKCTACGKPKPPRRKPAHMAALDLTYEQYIEINGGEFCGLCGKTPTGTRKLDRDHDHRTGRPRGLLCPMPCNKALASWMTVEWLENALAYLRRAEAR